MSKVIYKLQLREEKTQKVLLPLGAEIISIRDQLGITCIWFICNNENYLAERTIHTFMTGQELPKDISTLKFIGTVLYDSGNFVLHFFEGKLP